MSAVFRFGSGLAEEVEADLVLSIEPSSEAELAQHPIEDGSQLTDHVIRRPRGAKLEVVFSPEPEGRPNAQPSGPSRPEMARRRLLRACDQGEVCQVRVDGDSYYPAVLTSVMSPRAFADGTARRVQVQVQELLVAESQTVRVPKKRLAAGVRHKAKTKDKGATGLDLVINGFIGAAIEATSGKVSVTP